MASTDHPPERARAEPLALAAVAPMPSGRSLAATDEGPTPPSASRLAVASERHADLGLLLLEGPLDIYTTPTLGEFLEPFDPAIQLVIDLAAVTLLDATGLGALLSLRNEAHRAGRRLGLVCPNRRLTQVFWFTGVRPAFIFGDDLAAVRAALAAREGEPVSAAAAQAH
jgi:anti-sigma B factor antagonist